MSSELNTIFSEPPINENKKKINDKKRAREETDDVSPSIDANTHANIIDTQNDTQNDIEGGVPSMPSHNKKRCYGDFVVSAHNSATANFQDVYAVHNKSNFALMLFISLRDVLSWLVDYCSDDVKYEDSTNSPNLIGNTGVFFRTALQCIIRSSSEEDDIGKRLMTDEQREAKRQKKGNQYYSYRSSDFVGSAGSFNRRGDNLILQQFYEMKYDDHWMDVVPIMVHDGDITVGEQYHALMEKVNMISDEEIVKSMANFSSSSSSSASSSAVSSTTLRLLRMLGDLTAVPVTVSEALYFSNQDRAEYNHPNLQYIPFQNIHRRLIQLWNSASHAQVYESMCGDYGTRGFVSPYDHVLLQNQEEQDLFMKWIECYMGPFYAWACSRFVVRGHHSSVVDTMMAYKNLMLVHGYLLGERVNTSDDEMKRLVGEYSKGSYKGLKTGKKEEDEEDEEEEESGPNFAHAGPQ